MRHIITVKDLVQVCAGGHRSAIFRSTLEKASSSRAYNNGLSG
jgi:rhodanese-related sulfurtransferase